MGDRGFMRDWVFYVRQHDYYIDGEKTDYALFREHLFDSIKRVYEYDVLYMDTLSKTLYLDNILESALHEIHTGRSVETFGGIDYWAEEKDPTEEQI